MTDTKKPEPLKNKFNFQHEKVDLTNYLNRYKKMEEERQKQQEDEKKYQDNSVLKLNFVTNEGHKIKEMIDIKTEIGDFLDHIKNKIGTKKQIDLINNNEKVDRDLPFSVLELKNDQTVYLYIHEDKKTKNSKNSKSSDSDFDLVESGSDDSGMDEESLNKLMKDLASDDDKTTNNSNSKDNSNKKEEPFISFVELEKTNNKKYLAILNGLKVFGLNVEEINKLYKKFKGDYSKMFTEAAKNVSAANIPMQPDTKSNEKSEESILKAIMEITRINDMDAIKKAYEKSGKNISKTINRLVGKIINTEKSDNTETNGNKKKSKKKSKKDSSDSDKPSSDKKKKKNKSKNQDESD